MDGRLGSPETQAPSSKLAEYRTLFTQLTTGIESATPCGIAQVNSELQRFLAQCLPSEIRAIAQEYHFHCVADDQGLVIHVPIYPYTPIAVTHQIRIPKTEAIKDGWALESPGQARLSEYNDRLHRQLTTRIATFEQRLNILQGRVGMLVALQRFVPQAPQLTTIQNTLTKLKKELANLEANCKSHILICSDNETAISMLRSRMEAHYTALGTELNALDLEIDAASSGLAIKVTPTQVGHYRTPAAPLSEQPQTPTSWRYLITATIGDLFRSS